MEVENRAPTAPLPLDVFGAPRPMSDPKQFLPRLELEKLKRPELLWPESLSEEDSALAMLAGENAGFAELRKEVQGDPTTYCAALEVVGDKNVQHFYTVLGRTGPDGSLSIDFAHSFKLYAYFLGRSYLDDENAPTVGRLEGEVPGTNVPGSVEAPATLTATVLHSMVSFFSPRGSDGANQLLKEDFYWVLLEQPSFASLPNEILGVLARALLIQSKLDLWGRGLYYPIKDSSPKNNLEKTISWAAIVNEIYEQHILPFLDGQSETEFPILHLLRPTGGITTTAETFRSDTLLVPCGWVGHGLYLSVNRMKPGVCAGTGKDDGVVGKEKIPDCFLVEVFNHGLYDVV